LNPGSQHKAAYGNKEYFDLHKSFSLSASCKSNPAGDERKNNSVNAVKLSMSLKITVPRVRRHVPGLLPGIALNPGAGAAVV
jgi:hypothetical protein